VVAGPTRPDIDVHDGLMKWLQSQRSELGLDVLSIDRPTTGWSNETVLITTDTTRFVVRLPAVVPAYPDYDLTAQADVLRVLNDHDIPAPHALAIETDTRWLGVPFLVMDWVDGLVLGEVPALDPILQGASPQQRLHLHEQYADALAAVHRITDASLLPSLRQGMADELTYWTGYIEWSTHGSPPQRLADALQWCKDTMPTESPNVLLWGDPRLGNAMYDDDGTLIALLDWELSSFGPSEMDLAWYTVLGELTASFMGADPEGMLGTDELIARHARALGRAPENLGWHQIFALVRSTAINDCMARLAHAHGLTYPGIAGDKNPILDVISSRITTFES
jgi:aminoglycoside phosphotransferase (APT) family kinase protein